MSAFAQRVQLGPFFDGGVLQGAAKLYHYEAGTSTLKNIWSDRGMTTTLAQPFVSDSQGVFNFYADGLYKFIIVGPNSTGPASDVLYTLDNWQFVDQTDPTFGEGQAIASASTIAVGPEVWGHITGSTNIDTITGTVPFYWLAFDGSLSLVHSASLICPGATNCSVTTGDVVFALNDGAGVWRVAGKISQSLLNQANDVIVNASDGRTNTVNAPLTVRALTTNTPAAGIGVGQLFQAESADESPSNFGQTEFVASDVTAGSEDTYFQILLRRAGAALAAAYRWVATTAFNAVFTHANTADRTYTMANRSCVLGHRYDAPTATGTGSTLAHEGSVQISANQNLDGIHFYTDFTLDAGDTITLTNDSRFLAIYATGTITINGTIAANGAGNPGAASPTGAGLAGSNGTDQPGGNGGSGNGGGNAGGSGGDVYIHGCQISSGNTQVSGGDIPLLPFPIGALGGAGGGSGGDGSTGNGGAGGDGGGSIILVAPTIVLAATAVLNTSGASGSAGTASNGGGGGGGGAGNVYILCHHFTDNGATFTQAGGGGGGSDGTGVNGSAGAAGVKQINIY